MTELKACPFCGSSAKLEDHRLIWAVRCTACPASVIGDRAPEPHGDGESSDEVQDAQAQKMSGETDWAHYEKTAVDARNRQEAK
ncbi:Lar family restriction alleviation protein [Pseudomonas bubulae]|uniref:Lar family restriction alleviation protein n=1 Tax=Pseudomonas bubulae TaxID=2316085 RepID=UPI003D0805C8